MNTQYKFVDKDGNSFDITAFEEYTVLDCKILYSPDNTPGNADYDEMIITYTVEPFRKNARFIQCDRRDLHGPHNYQANFGDYIDTFCPGNDGKTP